jgi:FMN-dependent NADH-azoreductase
LSKAFALRWRQRHPDGVAIHHNTTLEQIPFLDAEAVAAWFVPLAELTMEQRLALAYSDQLVDELLSADVLALGVPMWNLGIPASLKAWIDLIVRAGRTFAFAEEGVVPLVPAEKRVYVFSARGGSYAADSAHAALDHLEPHLRAILGSIGLTQVDFIYADHQSGGAEKAAKGFAAAQREIAQLEL